MWLHRKTVMNDLMETIICTKTNANSLNSRLICICYTYVYCQANCTLCEVHLIYTGPICHKQEDQNDILKREEKFIWRDEVMG
jgi:hypothetical protein